MSQVKFTTRYDNHNVKIMGGYDRPINAYHLAIFNLDAKESEDDVIWSSLDHFDFSELKEMAPLKEVLGRMGIIVPPGFWERAELHEGNVIHEFGNGAWSKY